MVRFTEKLSAEANNVEARPRPRGIISAPHDFPFPQILGPEL